MTTNATAEALRKRSRKTITIDDPDDNTIQYHFKIRALSTFELAEHSDIFDSLPKEGVILNPKNQDESDYEMLKKVILPMMKIFLPMCTMEPKITFNMDEESVDPPVVHIGDIPMVVASLIFKEILDLSGISKDAENARKKKTAEAKPIPSIKA